MVICKFTKTDSAVYLPHLDLLREMGRAVRRADLSVKFSEGFNPHMLLYFSQPLPLGLSSLAEYFCADSEEDPEHFRTELNRKLPRGVRILAASHCEKASVHAEITHAEYRYKAEKPFKKSDLEHIMSRITLEIPVKTKKGMTVSDVRARIFSLEEDRGDAVAVLGCGRDNLRADSFGAFLSSELGCGEWSVEKEESLILSEAGLRSVDEVYDIKA